MGQFAIAADPVAAASDERRHARAGRRAQIETLLERAAHLPPADRLLVRQIFEFGLKAGDIAQFAGCPRSRIYRRIRAILKRMRSPLFHFAVAGGPRLPSALRQTARCVACLGMTQAQTAAYTGRSRHAIRRDLLAANTLAATQ